MAVAGFIAICDGRSDAAPEMSGRQTGNELLPHWVNCGQVRTVVPLSRKTSSAKLLGQPVGSGEVESPDRKKGQS